LNSVHPPPLLVLRVSRLLSGWEAMGMVTLRRGWVTICSAESLHAMSER
jgi:hypothetical protein